jgi:hypothetical protein
MHADPSTRQPADSRNPIEVGGGGLTLTSLFH